MTRGDSSLREYEAASGALIRNFGVGIGGLNGVDSDGTDVWVTSEQGDMVGEIEAATGTLIREIPVSGAPIEVSSDGTDVWVVTWHDGVNEIEAATGTVIRTIPVGSLESEISADGTDVWVTNPPENTVSEIEAATGTVVRTIPVGMTPLGVSSDGTDVWVTQGSAVQSGNSENTVTEIEAATGTIINTIPVGSYPWGVDSDGTHVWVVNFGKQSSGGTVSEISPSYTPPPGTCPGDSGTVKLSPGLRNTAAAQTMKIKGTLTGCAGEPFTTVEYKATLKTAGPVSCSALTGAGEPATGPVTYKWLPKPKGVKPSPGLLSMPLTETPGIAFSGDLTSGSFSPLTLTGTGVENYNFAAETCGVPEGGKAAKPVTKGIFGGSPVSLE